VKPEKTPRERARDLINLLVPDWRPSPQQVLWAVRIAIFLCLLVAVGYAYGITLWDWIKLLIVPAVIAGGGLWFNRQQREREVEIAERRAQDEALQAYLDQMSGMLIPNTDQPSLYKARPGDSLSSVARARTLTVLARLDGNRKARVVQFLSESGLIERGHNIISLLLADLRKAKMEGASLREIDLRGANLRRG
jgi:Pentapeptide repeats (8 copies)